MRFGLDGIPLTQLKTGAGHDTAELSLARVASWIIFFSSRDPV
jgi:hypothetical protein